MDVFDRIRQQLAENTVVLYMKGTPQFPQCGFSGQAVQVLMTCGCEFAHVNILEDPEIREKLKEFSQWPTFPQLFIKGELVGGSDILLELYQQGTLQQMLAEAGSESGAG